MDGARHAVRRPLLRHALLRPSAPSLCPSLPLQVAATPAEVVACCDITLAMLSDPEACLAVATGGWVGGGGGGRAAGRGRSAAHAEERGGMGGAGCTVQLRGGIRTAGPGMAGLLRAANPTLHCTPPAAARAGPEPPLRPTHCLVLPLQPPTAPLPPWPQARGMWTSARWTRQQRLLWRRRCAALAAPTLRPLCLAARGRRSRGSSSSYRRVGGRVGGWAPGRAGGGWVGVDVCGSAASCSSDGLAPAHEPHPLTQL